LTAVLRSLQGIPTDVRATMVRLLAFLLLFGAMYGALSYFWASNLSHWVIDVVTVEPAAWLARTLTGDTAIVASGARLAAPGASITVLFGCEGSDVLMLLCAALLVAPSPLPKRLLGLLAGAALVFLINQGRVLALFFAFRNHRDWFGPIHGLIGPMFVIVIVTAFFLAWLRWALEPVDAKDAAA
jgi:exosortase family protein XrtM